MQVVIAIAVGVLAGTHVATWGMYKDAPHEGFTWRRYLRSIGIGAAVGPLLARLPDARPDDAGSLLLLFGLTYVAERAVTEFWKTFLRDEDQSKYFIPMQFTVLGRPVSRATRLAVGIAAVSAGAVLLIGVNGLLRTPPGLPRTLIMLTVGSLGGWYSAFGGAWKDAPYEGFELLKFFRSPVLAAVYALLLARVNHDPIPIAFAALGYTIATLETYKTFFFPSKPRGKFAGKPIRFPDMLRFRRRFVPLYAAIWACIAATFILSCGRTL